jgi:CheY-like chemotaxis protein
LHARSVREARRLMQSIRPVAILLDVMLLGDESWRLLLELRAQDASAEIPLIVTSSTGEARKAAHLGADQYLEKPVDGERLIEVLDRVTGRNSLIQVLVVDDEELTHYLVRQLLPRTRYRLCSAMDGKAALDRMEEGSPDVVLLDLRMPGMNGFEFLRRLRQDGTWADLPVIVLSSAVLEPGERALLRDASLLMSKSELASGTLIEAIDSVLWQNAPA